MPPRQYPDGTIRAWNASRTSEGFALLITIDHPRLNGEPIRLCSHPAQMLSRDPLKFGLISQGHPYYFVIMQVARPDDAEGAAPRAQIMLANLRDVADEIGVDIGGGVVALLRSFSNPKATVAMRIVSTATPDEVETDQWVDLKLVDADYDDDTITLAISQEPVANESWPSYRMTKRRAPALFR